MPPDPQTARDLLGAALRIAEPADRAAYLDRACAGDGELRRLLDRLVAERAGLATTPGPAAAPDDPTVTVPGTPDADPAPTLRPGEGEPDADADGFPPVAEGDPGLLAGRYRVRDEIGAGGMGSVFLADQVGPVRRQVAVKLIRPGLNSRMILARFDSERQALALMDHPHVARILDAGTTEEGRPFFVMELVRGLPLTDYCDAHRLAPPDRLDLFRRVCLAVHHAHQKGIIHRDLKPSNILVEHRDGRPEPKVIDFGLAKAIGGAPLSGDGSGTMAGSVAGTPRYMAPEQADPGALDIDTRADIYALGVILYELLTGTTPLRPQSLSHLGLNEVLRRVREEEPPTPSSRIGTAESPAAAGPWRRADPLRLGRYVRGDLDWITLKALSKERHRRYDSAAAFAEDVARFLRDEPVAARPPGRGYRLGKFVRRHRWQVGAGVALLLTLVGGVVGTSLGLIEARRQRAAAMAAAAGQQQARLAERSERVRAEARLSQVDKIGTILESIFERLDPRAIDRGGKPLVVQLGEQLERAAGAIEGEAIGDPVAVARFQKAVGTSLANLGSPARALDLFEKARATFAARLGPDHPDTLTCLNNLAAAHHDLGHPDRAVPIHEKVLRARRAKLGADHPDTLASQSNLAVCLRSAGRPRDALPVAEEALNRLKAAAGEDHPATFACTLNLAACLETVGQGARAVPLLEGALGRMKAALGEDHPDTLACMNNLATALLDQGRPAQARPIFEQALRVRESKIGPDHPDTLNSASQLANCLIDLDEAGPALALHQRALAGRRAKLGPDHPGTLQSLVSVASCHWAAGRRDEALPLFREALDRTRARLGPDHPDALTALNNLATCLKAVGRVDEAVPLYEETLARAEAAQGPDGPMTLNAMSNLASALRAAGQAGPSVALYEKALGRMRAKYGADHPDTLNTAASLASGLLNAGEFDRAAALFRDAIGSQKRLSGGESPAYATLLSNVAQALLAKRRWAEAEPILRELSALREKAQPDAWSTFSARSMLGASLLGQGKAADAEPLLRSGFEGMKQRAGQIPAAARSRLVDAADRLAEWAEAAGKPDEAKAWREEKARLLAEPAGPAKP